MESRITLWTLQSISDWNILQKFGVLQRYSVHLPDSYKWMMEQMTLRIPHYTGRAPVWAWYQPKPDLRFWSWRVQSDEQFVRIEFRVERSNVLLSNFDVWHAILNGWYLPLTKEEDNESLKRSQEEMRESWNRIFDLELLENNPCFVGEGPQCIQAVLEEVTLEQVVKVTIYKGHQKQNPRIRRGLFFYYRIRKKPPMKGRLFSCGELLHWAYSNALIVVVESCTSHSLNTGPRIALRPVSGLSAAAVPIWYTSTIRPSSAFQLTGSQTRYHHVYYLSIAAKPGAVLCLALLAIFR